MSEEGPYSPHTPPEPHTPFHAPPPEPDELFDIRGTLEIGAYYHVNFQNEEEPRSVHLTYIHWPGASTTDNNKWTAYPARNVTGKNAPHHIALLGFHDRFTDITIEISCSDILDSSGVSIQKHVIGHRGDRTGAMTLTLSDAVKSRGIRIYQPIFLAPPYPAPLRPQPPAAIPGVLLRPGEAFGGRRRRNTRKRRSKRSKKTRKHVRR